MSEEVSSEQKARATWQRWRSPKGLLRSSTHFGRVGKGLMHRAFGLWVGEVVAQEIRRGTVVAASQTLVADCAI